MFLYQGNTLTEITTTTDLTKLGNVTFSDLKSLPFLALNYKGYSILRNSTSMCGDFGGDCEKFLNHHLNIYWKNEHCISDFKCEHLSSFESHVCTPEEITQ